MDYDLSKDTFFVTELFSPKLNENGSYNYYLIEKKGISHKQLLRRLPKDALFCGIKDRNATTRQWMCTKQNIEDISEENLVIHFQGKSEEKLHIGAHKGNAFKVLVELSESEEKELKKLNKKDLICNYFGEQRLSLSSTKIFEAIEKNDFENALRLFLCTKNKFDTEKSRSMKELILKKWGSWRDISEHELIKDTGKKVLFDFLSNNPSSFEEAFLHAEPKSVKQLIKTMQAIRFNDALAKETLLKKPNNIFTEILGQSLPLSASKAMKRELQITPTEFEKKIFKGTLIRKTFFSAKNTTIKKVSDKNYWLSFQLGCGEYATVYLKYLKAKLLAGKSI